MMHLRPPQTLSPNPCVLIPKAIYDLHPTSYMSCWGGQPDSRRTHPPTGTANFLPFVVLSGPVRALRAHVLEPKRLVATTTGFYDFPEKKSSPGLLGGKAPDVQLLCLQGPPVPNCTPNTEIMRIPDLSDTVTCRLKKMHAHGD